MSESYIISILLGIVGFFVVDLIRRIGKNTTGNAKLIADVADLTGKIEALSTRLETAVVAAEKITRIDKELTELKGSLKAAWDKIDDQKEEIKELRKSKHDLKNQMTIVMGKMELKGWLSRS